MAGKKTPTPQTWLHADELFPVKPRSKRRSSVPTKIAETEPGDVIEIMWETRLVAVRVMWKWRDTAAHVRMWINEQEFGIGFNVEANIACKNIRTNH